VRPWTTRRSPKAFRSWNGSLAKKTVRAGEHELFKARAKDKGHVKLIDIITARLDAATDSFVATLPSLQLKDVRIGEKMVNDNERMLTGGFYAEVELAYDPAIAQEKSGRPSASSRCARSSYRSAKCCRRCIKGGRNLTRRRGKAS